MLWVKPNNIKYNKDKSNTLPLNPKPQQKPTLDFTEVYVKGKYSLAADDEKNDPRVLAENSI